jgi:TM2 domain-containing membrane protein YozV
MNCAIHTDTPAAAFCRTCGKALCENCKRDVMGAIYCETCIAARLQGAPAAVGQPVAAPAATVPNAPSPGVAMLLGFIPGVGAMYNGQFMKAFVHVVVFVLLIMAADSVHGAFGILIPFWIFYMAFDAYKTAQAKMLGLPAPDPLGLDRLFGIHEGQQTASAPFATPPNSTTTVPVAGAAVPPPPNTGEQPLTAAAPAEAQAPVGAIVLIGLGVLFLLGNTGWFNLHRMWPVILIAVGLWIAYRHMAQSA